MPTKRFPQLDDPLPEWADVGVLRLMPGTGQVEGIAADLAVPDGAWLAAWSAYVHGRGRSLPLPAAGQTELALAYATGLRDWLRRHKAAAHAGVARHGLNLDAWNGPVLCREHFRIVPRKEGERLSFDLLAFPGMGLKHVDQRWESTGLLPQADILDPDGHLRDALDDALTSYLGPLPAEVLGDKVGFLAGPRAIGPGPSDPIWTLRSTTSVPWSLQVFQPAVGKPSAPARLVFDARDPPPNADRLRLSFVCVDREQHWTQTPREIAVVLAAHGSARGEDIACSTSTDYKRWHFELPARRLLDPLKAMPPHVVCVGISVTTLRH